MATTAKLLVGRNNSAGCLSLGDNWAWLRRLGMHAYYEKKDIFSNFYYGGVAHAYGAHPREWQTF